MSQLSSEDSFRLNVLLNQNLQAVRIDEGKMIVHALTDKGEAKVPLNPNLRDDAYIRNVKELFSTHVLGTAGGYPVFLKRWTRMGQARDTSLEGLLKLGESEAVVAVVHAAGLSDELARRAWWAMPNTDNARHMLEKSAIAKGEMGKILAEFLVEFLPFEENPADIIHSVRLVLQPGLIDEKMRQDLWKRGQRKNVFRVGFLLTLPDEIPEEVAAHPSYAGCHSALNSISEKNPVAAHLLKLLDSQGQAFIKTVQDVIKKPSNQAVVVSSLQAIQNYFYTVRPDDVVRREIGDVLQQAKDSCNGSANEMLGQVVTAAPELAPQIESMLAMSLLGEPLVDPIFKSTNMLGSVMRKKLEPISKPVLALCEILSGTGR